MADGLKQCIDADSGHLIRNLPQSKLLLTQFISIPGRFTPKPYNNTSPVQSFDDPSPWQYAIICNKSNALHALLTLSCNTANEERPENRGFGLSIDDVFFPRPFSTNCKLPLLNLAVRVNSFRCLKILVEYLKARKKSIDTVDRDFHTPLLEAVLNSNSELALYLLREGADPLFSTKDNVLLRQILNALFVMPELFIWMVKALAELNKTEKYQQLFTEKYDPRSFQLSPNGKSLQDILATRQDLAFSRSVLNQVINAKDIAQLQVGASDNPQNTVAPQQEPPIVEFCEECKTNPACIVCARCGRHLCAEHEQNHECK